MTPAGRFRFRRALSALPAFALLLMLCVCHVSYGDTLRVATYNALNFRGQPDADRYDDFRTVIRAIHPDAVVMQEIIYDDAVEGLLSHVYLNVDDDWAAAPFMNGDDTDNALFYRTSKVEWISQRLIHTELREIAEYVLRPLALDSTERFRVYSAHLKAGDQADEVEQRGREARVLRNVLDTLSPGSYFVVCGDFNLYTWTEPAYQVFLSADPDPDGQLWDPIGRPGEWHEAISFAEIHTQSPRTQSFGGGATGGLDDRFDFILASTAFMDTAGCYVIPSSYYAVGNDGRHFNQAVNDGVNYAVPDSVADALHYASDHLPVAADFVMRSSDTPAPDRPSIPQKHSLLRCYPNPFNSRLAVELPPFTGSARLEVFDTIGRRIVSIELAASNLRHPLSIDFDDQPSGTYLVRFSTARERVTQRVSLLH